MTEHAIWSDVTVVVPFRLASERFPNKALCRFRGKTLVEHAVDNGAALSPRRVVLAAPAEDLETVGKELDFELLGRNVGCGLELRPTSVSCQSSHERVLELYRDYESGLFLTLPIDEPVIRPSELRAAVSGFEAFDGAGVITFYCDFYAEEDYLSPLSAKVVVDRRGMMLYMSRGIIPVRKDGSVDPAKLKKNVGAYLFKRSFLDELAARVDEPTLLDRHEGCEQLRWIELGFAVKFLKIEHLGVGIDVADQLAVLEERVER